MRDYHRFRCCPPLQGKLSTCYSPVCHADYSAFDLHVLGASLAFILSQDQTLHKNDRTFLWHPEGYKRVLSLTLGIKYYCTDSTDKDHECYILVAMVALTYVPTP